MESSVITLKKPLNLVLFGLLCAVFFSSFWVLPAHAATSTTAPLPKVNLLPSSSFYFLKEWKRGIERIFTTKPEDKVKLELRVRDERAAELEKMKTEKGVKDETIEDAISSYSESDALVDESIQALEIVDKDKAKMYSDDAEVHSEIHKEILLDLEDKVSDPEIKQELNTLLDTGDSPTSGVDEEIISEDGDLSDIERELNQIIGSSDEVIRLLPNASSTEDKSITENSKITVPLPTFTTPTVPLKPGASYCEKLMNTVAGYEEMLKAKTLSKGDFDAKIKSFGKDYERCLTFLPKSDLKDDGSDPLIPNNSKVFCTADYSPVCGVDGRTYSNECLAKSAKVEIKARGECASAQ